MNAIDNLDTEYASYLFPPTEGRVDVQGGVRAYVVPKSIAQFVVQSSLDDVIEELTDGTADPDMAPYSMFGPDTMQFLAEEAQGMDLDSKNESFLASPHFIFALNYSVENMLRFLVDSGEVDEIHITNVTMSQSQVDNYRMGDSTNSSSSLNRISGFGPLVVSYNQEQAMILVPYFSRVPPKSAERRITGSFKKMLSNHHFRPRNDYYWVITSQGWTEAKSSELDSFAVNKTLERIG